MKAPNSRLFALIVCLALISLWSVYSDAQETDQSKKLEDIEHTPWEDTTITLLNSNNRTTTEIAAKSAIYRLRDDFLCRVTVFKSSSGELFWIGPERDFYIELENGISGGLFPDAGIIRWCQSMVSKSTPDPTTLNSVITAFEQETEVKTLADSMIRHSLKSQEEQIWNATDLRRTFARGAGAFTGGWIHPNGIEFKTELDDSEIKITIENPFSSFHGEVWIDPTTRKVTKSTQLSPAKEQMTD